MGPAAGDDGTAAASSLEASLRVRSMVVGSE